MLPAVSPRVTDQFSYAMQEEHRNEAALMELGASAQLHHQLAVLGSALQTAQLDPAHFGLAATVSHIHQCAVKYQGALDLNNDSLARV